MRDPADVYAVKYVEAVYSMVSGDRTESAYIIPSNSQ